LDKEEITEKYVWHEPFVVQMEKWNAAAVCPLPRMCVCRYILTYSMTIHRNVRWWCYVVMYIHITFNVNTIIFFMFFSVKVVRFLEHFTDFSLRETRNSWRVMHFWPMYAKNSCEQHLYSYIYSIYDKRTAICRFIEFAACNGSVSSPFLLFKCIWYRTYLI